MGPVPCSTRPSAIGGVVNVTDTRIPRKLPSDDRRASGAELRLRGQRAVGQLSASMCRSAAISSRMPTAPIRNTTICMSAAISCRSRFGSRPLPAPTPDIRALAGLRDGCRTRPVALTTSRAGSPMSTATSTSAFRSATTTQLWRPDPLLARSRRSNPNSRLSMGTRPAPTCASTCRSAASSSCSSFAAALQNIIMTKSTPRANSDPASRERRRDARRSRPDRARRMGRHERRPVSRPARPASAATRNISPTAASGDSAFSRCNR